VPSLDWNRRWGSDCFHQLRKGGLRYYGEQWGDPAASPLRRWLGVLTGKSRFRKLPVVVRDYLAPYVGPDRVCLEIGPGGGRWTQFLLGARELILVELNPEFFEYLRGRFPEALPRMRFYPTSGYELAGIGDGSVDFAFSFGTFVHLEPEGIDAYLAELRRVLRPGGVAVIQYADKTKPRGRENADFSDMTPARMEALAAARSLRLRAHDTTLLLHSSIAVLEK
jgi:SAM-dependent methyltransferase